jgi:hypothetical protein
MLSREDNVISKARKQKINPPSPEPQYGSGIAELSEISRNTQNLNKDFRTLGALSVARHSGLCGCHYSNKKNIALSGDFNFR